MAKITAGGITVEFDPTTSSFFIDNNPFDKAGALKKINALEAGIDIDENDKKKLLSFIKKQGVAQTNPATQKTAKPSAQDTGNGQSKTAPASVPPIRVNVADALKTNGDIKVLFDTSKGFTPNLSVWPAHKREVFDRLYAQMLLQKDFIQFIIQYDGFDTPNGRKGASLDAKVQILKLFFEQNGQKVQGDADIVAKTMKKLNPLFKNPFETTNTPRPALIFKN